MVDKMKKMKNLLTASVLLTASQMQPGAQAFLNMADMRSPEPRTKAEVSVERNFELNADFSPIDMIELPNVPGVKFEEYTIGEGSQSYTAKRWIRPFRMNRYETTYGLWYYTKSVAEQIGYKFLKKGRGGSDGKTGAEPTPETENKPVTFISWYDAVVWCNALSELHGLEPCYKIDGENGEMETARDATDSARLDLAECDFSADGYRLPTEAEWEYAARKVIDGFTGGDILSGQAYTADTPAEERIGEDTVAWTMTNASCAHVVGTAGTSSSVPGTGNPNSYGIFDLSGNVLEFCWDWFEQNYSESEPFAPASGAPYGIDRVCRGGSFSGLTLFSAVGDRYHYDPNEFFDFIGFRVVRSAAQ